MGVFDKIPTTIRISQETKTGIEDIALIEHRSFNSMVEYILEMYLLDYINKKSDIDDKTIEKRLEEKIKKEESKDSK